MAVITDGTAKFRVRTVFQMPSGAVLPFAGNTVPKGWLLCNGQAVSRTDYDELFGVIGTTYGTGDGSTTFNLPNLVDKFVEGGSTSGAVKSAGLPNITGRWTNEIYYIPNGTGIGAYTIDWGSRTGGYALSSDSSSKKTYATMSFAASKSNSIYGASTTVQPPAIVMKYIIKA